MIMANNTLKKVGIFLEEGAIMPSRAYDSDVGYDLYALENAEILPGTFALVRTGVHLALPKNMFAQVNTRSSYGKNGMYCHHGVIDPGYTGEISIWVMNIADSVLVNGTIRRDPFHIERGHKVAQLLFHKAETPMIEQVDVLPKTARGEKGHGSSGK